MNKLVTYTIISTISILTILLSFMIFNFIGSIVLGLFLYYVSEPVYKYLRNYNISKTTSALSALISLILPIVIILSYTIRIIAIEFRSISIQLRSISTNSTDLGILKYLQSEPVNDLIININNISQIQSIEDIEEIINSFDASFVSSVIDISVESSLIVISSLSDIFFTLFIAFAIAFYSLKNGENIKKKVYELIQHDPDIIQFWEKLDRKLQMVYIGNIGLAIFTAIIAVVSFTLISYFIPGGGVLRYPALIGILCGLTSIIPVFGVKIIYIPITLILYTINLLQYGFPEGVLFPTVFIVVSVIIVDVIPDLIIRPKIGSMGGVSMGVVLLSFVLGPLTFGWYGLFLGPIVFVVIYEFINELLPKIMNNEVILFN